MKITFLWAGIWAEHSLVNCVCETKEQSLSAWKKLYCFTPSLFSSPSPSFKIRSLLYSTVRKRQKTKCLLNRMTSRLSYWVEHKFWRISSTELMSSWIEEQRSNLHPDLPTGTPRREFRHFLQKDAKKFVVVVYSARSSPITIWIMDYSTLWISTV